MFVGFPKSEYHSIPFRSDPPQIHHERNKGNETLLCLQATSPS